MPKIPNPRRESNTARGSRSPRDSQPDLQVDVTGGPLRFQAADLTDECVLSGLEESCSSSRKTPRFVVKDLLAWPDDARWAFLALVGGLGRTYAIKFRGDAATFKSLFDAVLHVAEGQDDVSRCERSRRAALEAAAIVYPDALEVACSRIAHHFREELGVGGILPQSLVKAARGLVGQADAGGELDPTEAAREFHNNLRSALGIEGDHPALRYFQHDFYAWNGRCWQRLDDEAVKARVTRYLQQADDCESVSDRFVRDVITNLRGMVLLDCWERQMPLWIASEEPLEVEPPRHIVFVNGMLDIDEATANCEPPDLYELDSRNFTQIALPYTYDAEADCPLWRETLREIFPRRGNGDRRIRVLQEFLGWSLVPNDLSFEKFVIFVGKGANGKTTISKTFKALLGAENVSHVPLEAFGSEFRLVNMMGKLANIASDMNYVNKVAEGQLKELTSGDPIQVNRKYKTPITMVPSAKLVFACNKLPQLNDKSDGVWRREIAIPFFVQFGRNRRDRQRADRLLAELPGIFNWALEGTRRLYRRGRFTECQVCRDCVAQHRFDSDPLRQFIDARAVVREGLVVESQALYQAYVDFCDANGYLPKCSSEFGKGVLDLNGVGKRRHPSGSRSYQYVGLGLLSGAATYDQQANLRRSSSRRRSSRRPR